MKINEDYMIDYIICKRKLSIVRTCSNKSQNKGSFWKVATVNAYYLLPLFVVNLNFLRLL